MIARRIHSYWARTGLIHEAGDVYRVRDSSQHFPRLPSRVSVRSFPGVRKRAEGGREEGGLMIDD